MSDNLWEAVEMLVKDQEMFQAPTLHGNNISSVKHMLQRMHSLSRFVYWSSIQYVACSDDYTRAHRFYSDTQSKFMISSHTIMQFLYSSSM